MVLDVFTYNGEKDILDIRFNVLDEKVDKFIIVEAKTTFSGKKKPLYFSRHENFFKKWWGKIEYHIIDENYSLQERELAENSPNTVGASHWKNEFLQKESIHYALERYARDDDTIYIGDVDEIWQPVEPISPMKLKLRVYAYYINNLSNEEFWGTVVARYGDIKNVCLNHLRSDTSIRTHDYHGWHFTSMGGTKEVRRKLNDSYTEESYNTKQVQELLGQRIKAAKDYLGRPFVFEKDTLHWPPYLKKHHKEYYHLCH